jgi:hypothetical protein
LAAKLKLLSRPRPLVHACLLALLACHANAGWQLVAQGDCVGPQLLGGAGQQPEAAMCTLEWAGKTALCFPQSCNPGCQYLDMPAQNCLPGADNGLIYTCEPETP